MVDSEVPCTIVDNTFEIKRVTKKAKTIKPKRIRAEVTVFIKLLAILETKNIEVIAIKLGNLPLQGEKTLVSIAIIFSLVLLIILHPITPQALQPYPMHIVRVCLPLEPHFLNILSVLNAILGR